MRDSRAHAIEENTSGLGQLDTPSLAAKQLNVELRFDCLDPLTERRLVHAEPFGSPRDMTFFGDDDELTEVSQLHSHTHSDMQFDQSI